MFNFLKNTFSNLTKIVKTSVVLKETAPSVSVETSKAPRVRKPKNEIDGIFSDLSKEMNIPFVKGPKAPKVAKTVVQDETGLISVGKKGVTNTQMIPALKSNMYNYNNLQTLYTTYPEVFKSSIKYMNKIDQQTLNSIVK